MAKIYWHTKTLFKQNWEYYWSYKHNHCIECKKCDFKHRGRWLCSSCREKERSKTEKRKEQKYRACIKRHKKNYNYIPVVKTKKPQTKEEKLEYQKKRYNENKEIIKIIKLWKKLNNQWIKCLQYITEKGKIIYVPPYEWSRNNNYLEKIIDHFNKK